MEALFGFLVGIVVGAVVAAFIIGNKKKDKTDPLESLSNLLKSKSKKQ